MQAARSTFYLQKRHKFPHLFNYPAGYDPVPPGYEHLKGRTAYGNKEQFTKEEVEAIHVYWGLDRLGLMTCALFMLAGSAMLALYPAKLRMDRRTIEMQRNWVALNRDKLVGTPYESMLDSYPASEKEES